MKVSYESFNRDLYNESSEIFSSIKDIVHRNIDLTNEIFTLDPIILTESSRYHVGHHDMEIRYRIDNYVVLSQIFESLRGFFEKLDYDISNPQYTTYIYSDEESRRVISAEHDFENVLKISLACVYPEKRYYEKICIGTTSPDVTIRISKLGYEEDGETRIYTCPIESGNYVIGNIRLIRIGNGLHISILEEYPMTFVSDIRDKEYFMAYINSNIIANIIKSKRKGTEKVYVTGEFSEKAISKLFE